MALQVRVHPDTPAILAYRMARRLGLVLELRGRHVVMVRP